MARICKVLIATSLLVLAACGSEDDSSATTTTVATTTEQAACAGGSITVAAAASLTESFEAMGEAVEAQCEGADITFTFDSSGTLSAQILEGAPVDVFASADEANAEKVAEVASGDAEPFATNSLVIVTKPGNPAGIGSLADLPGAGTVALCAEDAPCGKFAAQALTEADVTLDESQVTRGQNAKATLTAVAEGDAVAGIVYVTDAIAAGDAVEAVAIPTDQNVVATYPIVALDGPGDDALAQAFIAYVTGPDGAAVLADQGFEPPR